MFDGPSNVNVDWDGAGLVMDLSGVVDDQRAMALVMVAADRLVAASNATALAGRQRINVNDESYYMYKQAETVEFAQERRKLGRQYGEANIDICHRPSDLAAQADDGSKVAKMAHGLLPDSSMKIIFRQAAGELRGGDRDARPAENRGRPASAGRPGQGDLEARRPLTARPPPPPDCAARDHRHRHDDAPRQPHRRADRAGG